MCKCDADIIRENRLWYYYIFPWIYRTLLISVLALFGQTELAFFLTFGMSAILVMANDIESKVLNDYPVTIECEIETEIGTILLGVV